MIQILNYLLVTIGYHYNKSTISRRNVATEKRIFIE